MFKCVDWNYEKLFLENVNSSGPSLDILVVLSHFHLHFIVQEFNIFLIHIHILSEHFSDKFLNKERRINEYILVQLLRKYLSLQVLQVIPNNRVIKISLWFKLL